MAYEHINKFLYVVIVNVVAQIAIMIFGFITEWKFALIQLPLLFSVGWLLYRYLQLYWLYNCKVGGVATPEKVKEVVRNADCSWTFFIAAIVWTYLGTYFMLLYKVGDDGDEFFSNSRRDELTEECNGFKKWTNYSEERADNDNYACYNIHTFWNVDYLMIVNSIQFVLAVIGKYFSMKWKKDAVAGHGFEQTAEEGGKDQEFMNVINNFEQDQKNDDKDDNYRRADL